VGVRPFVNKLCFSPEIGSRHISAAVFSSFLFRFRRARRDSGPGERALTPACPALRRPGRAVGSLILRYLAVPAARRSPELPVPTAKGPPAPPAPRPSPSPLLALSPGDSRLFGLFAESRSAPAALCPEAATASAQPRRAHPVPAAPAPSGCAVLGGGGDFPSFLAQLRALLLHRAAKAAQKRDAARAPRRRPVLCLAMP